MTDDAVPPQPLAADRKAELMHRLRRAEGQVRGLQKLLEDGADCTKIAQQLLATRHALDSTYVRLNLSVAEHELAHPAGDIADAQSISDVLPPRRARPPPGGDPMRPGKAGSAASWGGHFSPEEAPQPRRVPGSDTVLRRCDAGCRFVAEQFCPPCRQSNAGRPE